MQSDPNPPRKALMMALDDYAFITVEGARALPLLQGQFTCDVNHASPSCVIEGAYCTPKGRVIANFLLWAATPERVVLRLRSDIVEPTMSVLSRYAALSRVTLQREMLVCTGVLGDGITAIGAGFFGDWPCEPLAMVSHDAHQVVQCDEVGRRFEIWSSPDALPELHHMLANCCTMAPSTHWRLALVRERKAEIVAATAGEFLPQMLGYDRGDMVSFRKGCYTGQEVVARARYKGSVKRRLYRLTGSSPYCPAPGSSLRQPGTGAPAGIVIDSAADGVQIELLAVLGSDPTPRSDTLLHATDGGIFQVLDEPCAILD